MLRTTAWTLVCATLALSSVFMLGCAGETDEAASNVWYDEETTTCYAEDENGDVVQVRCDNIDVLSKEMQSWVPPDGCSTPGDCGDPPDYKGR